jgi:hypothetical protein
MRRRAWVVSKHASFAPDKFEAAVKAAKMTCAAQSLGARIGCRLSTRRDALDVGPVIRKRPSARTSKSLSLETAATGAAREPRLTSSTATSPVPNPWSRGQAFYQTLTVRGVGPLERLEGYIFLRLIDLDPPAHDYLFPPALFCFGNMGLEREERATLRVGGNRAEICFHRNSEGTI